MKSIREIKVKVIDYIAACLVIMFFSLAFAGVGYGYYQFFFKGFNLFETIDEAKAPE